MGLTIYGADGVTEIWNSENVFGGVVVHAGKYAAAAAAVVTFPAYPGRTGKIVPSMTNSGTSNATLDYALGYPRLTVATSTFDRDFLVVLF